MEDEGFNAIGIVGDDDVATGRSASTGSTSADSGEGENRPILYFTTTRRLKITKDGV